VLFQLQLWARRSTFCVLFATLMALTAARVSAQNREQSSFLASTFKGVILDPTTYAPSVIAYDATMRDWNSSQVFFGHGFLEHNERFTVTGRPDDVAMSYTAGRRRILSDAFLNLQMSLVNNVTDRVFERVLLDRFPEHRKLVRALGWIERVSFASYLSLQLSAAHYRQAAQNEARAAQMGYR
jgi:hypothetical protein